MKLTNRFYMALFMLIVSSSVLVSMASANPISRQQALQNAQAFLSAKGKNIPQSSLRHAPSKSASATTEYYYVFNVGDNAGYVIAAGDDCAPAILGYADTGSVDVDAMPDNMKTWLEEYDSQIKYMQERGISSSGIRKAPHAPITPLLTTTWDQGDPYNQNCPDFFTSGKCVTGCVATAMAQVMYYHRTKSVTATTTTIPAYDCSTNWTSSSGEVLGHIHVEEVPAGSIIDWDNMLDSYSSSATTVQKQAVANLMRYCGASVNMNYRNSWNGGSSASSSSVPIALKKYFNYSDDSRYVSKSSYSESDWDNLIYGELASQRPVLYRGSTTSNEGHAFVCDGYDGNGYYHINWGWSGQSDGFFLLTALDPDIQGTGGSSGGGFNDSQAAVVYAEPKGSTPSVTGISFADSNVKALCVANWDSNGDGELTETEAAAVTSLGTVFKNNTSIKTFGELQYFTGLTSIVASAFEGCTALTTVTIPANVTAINSSAFKNCSKLSSITIPANVTTIGSNAFYGCSSLTSISIPASVTSITNGAFSYCSGLTNMTVASGNTTYNSDSSCKAIIKTSVNQLIAGCKNTVIPSIVTTIGSYAFQGMTGLTAITIPAGVTSINSYAFDGCSALTSVTVENTTPVSIGSTVFSNRANATLYVPAGSKTAYAAASYWKEFKEIIEPTIPSDNNITFADANVKALCVANWDTNGDGELGEAEAAAVTDLGSVFRYNSTVTSFNELRYFTSLTNIGSYAFYWCSGLTSITIPSSVTSFGTWAFNGCSGLTSITIPSNVTSISSDAFGLCSGLTSISVNSSNTVYDSRVNCNAIIEKASNTLIVGCKNTTIPSSVTSIGNYAFDGCTGLTSITIPSSVTSIGSSAFAGCSGLTSITIPSSVTSISSNAFGSCSGLTSISVNSSNTIYDSRNNCNAIVEKASNTLIAGCKNTTIPLSVTSIGNFAFSGCYGLTSITIPSSVTSIGSDAFYWCIGLTSITIPSSVTSIGNLAFSSCNKLASVAVEWTEPIAITNDVFSNRSNATLYVPAGSKASYEAADYWKEFKEIVEQSTPSSNNITFADANVKALCVANWDTNGDGELSETEAAAVTDLSSVFKENTTIVSFDELQYFTGLNSIGDRAFYYCTKLTTIIIPSNVTSIGDLAFYCCVALKTLEIPKSVNNIKVSQFQPFEGCRSLNSMTVQDGNTKYDSRNNCNAIIETASNTLIAGCKNTIIPSSITNIGKDAFWGCHFLKSIFIPRSVSSIGNSAFSECNGLESIIVEGENSVYDSRNNCNAIIEIESNSLVTGCKNTIIPNNVESIGSSAFWGCDGLTSITIPSSVKSIGTMAFRECNKLTNITIPNSVLSIGNDAFEYCHGLKSVSLSENLTQISSELFYGCDKLESISIPNNVTSIGYGAFGDCPSLVSVKVGSSTPISISSTTFSNRANATLYVPAGSKSAYKASDYWKEFKNIVEEETQKYTLEIRGFTENLSESHIYDRDGNEYDYIGGGNNEFAAGSYFRIVPFVPASLYIQDIIVNGTSLGPWTDENNSPSEYVIESLSENTTVEFKPYLREQWRTLICMADGPGNVKMYKNDVYLGTTDEANNQYFSSVFEMGDVMKLVFVPDEGCRLKQFLGGEYGNPETLSVDFLESVTDNTFTFTFNPDDIVDHYGYLIRGFGAYFEAIPQIITFADANVKALCVANWDTDGDGELSDAEAAAVTGLGTVFASNSNITKFDELQYFVGLTSINSHAFYFCTSLTSIIIPSSVTVIGRYSFSLCSKLPSIIIPSSVTSIDEYAFSWCNELTSVTVEWNEPLSINENVFYNCDLSKAILYVPAGTKAKYENADVWKNFNKIVETGAKYALEIEGFVEGHLYDLDGNEYDITDFSYNEFDAGSYIRICPHVYPNVSFINEIIVNGESVGTWTENTAPDEYVIEYLSCNTTVEFKTYFVERLRLLGCIANGPGNVEMYRNGNYVGTTTTENPYDTNIKLITEVFEEGDVLKLVFVPDEGSTLAGFFCGSYAGYEDIDIMADVKGNTYSISFPAYDGGYGHIQSFLATFEGPEPSTTNTLSAAVPTILTGKTATLSIGLTNEDEIIMTDFYMQLPDGISIVKDADGYYDVTLNSERSNRHNVEVDLNSEGLYHFLVYSTKNTALKGNDGELLSIPLVCEENMAAGTYQGMLKTIVMADIERNEITQENYSFAIEVLNVNPGDANADGRINGLDLVEVVDYIMERPSAKFVFAAADLNNDSKVNGLDLVREVDLIMSQSSGQNIPRRMAGTGVPLTDALHISADGMGMVTLGVESGEEFILAQCTIALSDGQTLSDVKTDDAHQAIWKPIGGNRYSVLVYSLRNKSFASNGCLLRLTNCSGSISVEDVMLVDANREARCFADVTFNGVTGIESIANQNDEESVYDLGGRKLESRNPKLENLPKGIYIVNGKKVVVK